MKKQTKSKWIAMGCVILLGLAAYISPVGCVDAHASQETAEKAGKEDESNEKTGKENHYSIKEVSKIEDKYNSIHVYSGALIAFRGSSYDLLDIHGEPIVENITSAEALFGDYVTADKKNEDEEEKNVRGLFTVEGEEIIPCEAASIAAPVALPAKDYRYIKVIYVTDKTDSTSDCILYYTDSMFSLSPSPDDTMYKGYYKVFDLEKRQFVSDLRFTGADSYSLHQCGDSFIIVEDGKYTQYDENGKELTSGDEYDIHGYSEECFVIEETDGSSVVIDDKGKEIYRSRQDIYPIERSDHGYLSIYDSNEYVNYIIDKNGKRISDFAFSDVPQEEHNNLFLYRNEEGDNRIVKSDGTIIVETAGYVTYDAPGYYLVETGLSEKALYDENGLVAEKINDNGCYLAYSDGKKALVINDGTFSIPLNEEGHLSALFYGMAYAEHGRTSDVYDMFTGEKLLSCENYMETTTVGRYVLQQDGDYWTVSEAFFNEEPVGTYLMKD